VTDADRNDPLFEVAGLIGDRRWVDWENLARQGVPAPDQAILAELKKLDEIAAAFDDVTPSAAVISGDTTRDEQDGDPASWAHLTILERIGQGQSARVYHARDEKLQTDVALKLFTGAGHGLHEARRLARVRHPNVVIVHGADERDGRAGLWMELIHGRTFAEVLATSGPLSAAEAIRVGMDLCGALAAVHAQELVHGDVKAHNVMRADGGRIVLMDLGTSKELRREQSVSRGYDFAGTPLYLPPEIFKGAVRTQATDLYALGVLLFHLVTRSHPVQGRTVEQVERAHEQSVRAYLRDLRPDLPADFVSVVERAVSPSPKERFATAGKFEQALGQCGASPIWGTKYLIGAIVLTMFAAGAFARFVPVSSVAPPGPPAIDTAAASAPLSYRIQTAFYRDSRSEPVRLRMNERLQPGAQIFAEIRTSIPTYVYIVNEDDRGNSFTLFPMPGQSVTNPLPADAVVRVPGLQGTKALNWVVDSPGEHEHFILFASPNRLLEYESTFAALPHPELDRPVAQLSSDALGALRSVGGLVAAASAAAESSARRRLSEVFKTPLSDSEETVNGVWIRQLTLDNPSR
jgi:tRNA A-37 threonylcarbamoyl transferase component Bud32